MTASVRRARARLGAWVVVIAAAAALVALSHPDARAATAGPPARAAARCLRPALRDASPHAARSVTVAGVRIEYLQWGGDGPALLFVPGLGHSAHVFDDFAPRLADGHRVIAVSRVGFGGSDQPTRHGYALAARVAQLRAVLDTLGVARAVLVGHSLGGDEITAFAARYPRRTAGVVYLDAALDHRQAATVFAALGAFAARAPRPTPADLATAARYRAFLGRALGVEVPMGEVLATTCFDADGAVARPRTPDRVTRAILADTRPLDFRGVRAPALALYADWSRARDVMPFLAADGEADERATAVMDSVLRPWVRAEQRRLRRELPQARLITFPSHHYQFLSHADGVEQLLREFLEGLSRAAVQLPAAERAAGSTPSTAGKHAVEWHAIARSRHGAASPRRT